MFTIIYEKGTGRVLNITSESNAEELEKSIPETSSYIFVEQLPQIKPLRQILMVKDGKLIVQDLILTDEQKSHIKQTELTQLRSMRKMYCFDKLNKAPYWYEELTKEQHAELKAWRKEWLDITNKYTFEVGLNFELPKTPNWLK